MKLKTYRFAFVIIRTEFGLNWTKMYKIQAKILLRPKENTSLIAMIFGNT